MLNERATVAVVSLSYAGLRLSHFMSFDQALLLFSTCTHQAMRSRSCLSRSVVASARAAKELVSQKRSRSAIQFLSHQQVNPAHPHHSHDALLDCWSRATAEVNEHLLKMLFTEK